MIKATGITAEFDPLHNGHVFIMEQTRALTGCDVLVVAMSGDYVQRGEPALLDKWTRCALALESGADLVAEIPVQFCLSDASGYAGAAVSMLEALGCSDISFGSECGDIGQLKRVAAVLEAEKEVIADAVAELTKDGMSFPAARSEAYRRLCAGSETGADPDILKSPNDILGFEYIRNMRRAVPVCVKRDTGFMSAATIRRTLSEGGPFAVLQENMPAATSEAIRGEKTTFPSEWSQILRYAAMRTPADVIEDCPSAGEGLGNLIKAAAGSAESFVDVIMAAKSKRYTYTRISRLCMQLILGITRSSLSGSGPEYIRILGFNDKGRGYLSEIKKEGTCGLPLITNINKEAHSLSNSASAMLDLDVKAADIYNLVTGRQVKGFSDHVMRPVII